MFDSMVRLIHDYQSHVQTAATAMQNKLGVGNLLDAWLKGEVPQKGSLDDAHESRFHFHGFGLCVESDRGDVDFDFGPEGRFDGFDGWRLWLFAQSHADQYPEFQKQAVVESVLGELVTDGLVVRPRWTPCPHLCYWTEDARSVD